MAGSSLKEVFPDYSKKDSPKLPSGATRLARPSKPKVIEKFEANGTSSLQSNVASFESKLLPKELDSLLEDSVIFEKNFIEFQPLERQCSDSEKLLNHINHCDQCSYKLKSLLREEPEPEMQPSLIEAFTQEGLFDDDKLFKIIATGTLLFLLWDKYKKV